MSKNTKKSSKKSSKKSYVRRSIEKLEEIKKKIRIAVRENGEGMTAAAIAKALRADPSEIRGPLKQLVAAGRIKTTGERRWTLYFSRKSEK